MTEPTAATLEELIEFLRYLHGPLHPGRHGVYFNRWSDPERPLQPSPLDLDRQPWEAQARTAFVARLNPMAVIRTLLVDRAPLQRLGDDREDQWAAEDVLAAMVDEIRRTNPYSVALGGALPRSRRLDTFRVKLLRARNPTANRQQLRQYLDSQLTEEELLGLLWFVPDDLDASWMRGEGIRAPVVWRGARAQTSLRG